MASSRFFGFSHKLRRTALGLTPDWKNIFQKEEVDEVDALCFGFRFLVETNLLYDNIDACLKAEETMRTEYARAYSQGTWGTTVGESNDPSVVSRFGRQRAEELQPVVGELKNKGLSLAKIAAELNKR